LKKDEYSLDRKTVTKVDVMNLLQAAGFSRSNPYYIVPQGRITALTNAQDSERLELLKEVAGTRVYEDHRAESLKILEETATKQAKITELLNFIDERLIELAEEKEELQKFQALDRQKRACEFILFSREAAETSEALEKLEQEEAEEEGRNSSDSTDSADFGRQFEAIAQLERELTNQKQQLQEADRDAEISRTDLDELQKKRAKLTVIVADWSASAGTHNRDISTLRASLQRVEEEIVRKETELAQLAPAVAEGQARQENLQNILIAEEAEKTTLISKQGRFSQFKSAAERDSWIQSQLKMLETTVQLQNQQSVEAETALQETRGQVDQLAIDVAGIEETASTAANRRDELDTAVVEARKARDLATDTRKELWRAEGKLQSALSAISEQVTNTERSFAGAVDRATWQGLETVRRASTGNQNVHGPLYELFQVSDSIFRPAVESIVGSSLFNVVVADDITATNLLEVLNREKGGRVTFIPLNRIRSTAGVEDDDFDDDESSPSVATDNLPKDCVKLIDRITFAPQHQNLFESIFGKAVLVPGLDRDLLEQIRSRGLTAITIDGDRADRRGTLFGGSLDTRKSRLEIAARLATWRQKEAENRALLADLTSRLLSADQHVTRTVSTLVNLEQQRSAAAPEKILATLNARRNELEGSRKLLSRRQESRDTIANEISNLQREIVSLQTELGQPLARASELERSRISALTEQIAHHRRELDEIIRNRGEISTRVVQLESLLNENLRKRRLDLLTRLASLTPRGDDQANFQDHLNSVQTALNEAQTRLDSALKLRDQSNSSISSLTSALEKSRASLEELQRKQSEKGSHLEKFMSRRALLLQRREECFKRIRELGVIAGDPEMESVESKLRDLSSPALVAALADCTATIKANFSTSARPPPNRKAAELHAAFSRQAGGLQARHNELQSSAQSITEFISVLDQRKDEAIMRTFEQVKENFEKVFERLCPSGFAKLVLVRDEEVNEPEVKRAKSKTSAAVPFIGIGIKASFASKSADEGLLIGQLSGGQKSLLALALIFAIQLVDPAPFYLFDEIDANLDAAARTAVAGLIHDLADPERAGVLGGENARAAPPAQFITTTFRPEMLKHADTFFGVSFAGRVSRVDEISGEQALEFIEHGQE
jgi:structural maintenance of chromosome 3 (chondroitin sulfate proteoglycan 6)